MWGTYYYYLLKSIQLQNLFAVWGPCGGLVLPQRNSLLSFAAVFFGKMQLHFWCVCIIFEWAQCGTASQWTKLSWVDQNSNKNPQATEVLRRLSEDGANCCSSKWFKHNFGFGSWDFLLMMLSCDSSAYGSLWFRFYKENMMICFAYSPELNPLLCQVAYDVSHIPQSETSMQFGCCDVLHRSLPRKLWKASGHNNVCEAFTAQTGFD